MAKNTAAKGLTGRRAQIDAAVNAAHDQAKKKKKTAPKNPHKPGSARAKYWARRQAEGTKMKKVKKKK